MKTKMYWASVRNKETNQIEIIKRDDYSSKKDFAHDLRVNGYAVRFISTPEKFDEDCENYYWKSEERKHARIVAKQHKSQPAKQTEIKKNRAERQKEVITMKATNYTNKELVEIYKNLKTSAKILGFSSANDSEMIAEIELEAIKRHLDLVDGTVEETAETETAKPETAETDDSGFEYYSVETAYEVDFRDKQSEVFKTYAEAEQTAGNDTFIEEVDIITRNGKKAQSRRDKQKLEAETAEIEARCIWYHFNGVKGMIAQDTKRVIKKPETDNRKEANNTDFQQQLYNAEYNKTFTVQGGIERFLKLAKEFVKNKSSEMSLIVDTAAQVLHDKYGLDYGTIETLEIEAYNS